MTLGMTTEKIAISVPRGVLRRVRAAVTKGRARSVSAYVTLALEERTRLDSLADLLDQMLLESGGPMTATERRHADKLLARATRPPSR
jgi:Arc/MetJ-type ribon-helix-helix transcriptional regulator